LICRQFPFVAHGSKASTIARTTGIKANIQQGEYCFALLDVTDDESECEKRPAHGRADDRHPALFDFEASFGMPPLTPVPLPKSAEKYLGQ